MEDMVFEHRRADEHQKCSEIEQPFCRDPTDQHVQDLGEMIDERQHTDDAAAGDHLDDHIVIHVRHKPVFKTVCPARIFGHDGRVESDAEKGFAQKIFQSVFPDEKALSSSVIVSEKSSEKIERVVVRVSYGNEIYDFPIGTKMHRKKFLGKFVLEVAEDFSKALSSKKA